MVMFSSCHVRPRGHGLVDIEQDALDIIVCKTALAVPGADPLQTRLPAVGELNASCWLFLQARSLRKRGVSTDSDFSLRFELVPVSPQEEGRCPHSLILRCARTSL